MSQERTQELELALIVTDDELKVRVEIDPKTAQDYYDAMETEEEMRKFPHPTVYFDGCRYWLADGQHRYWAAFRRGYKSMTVKVVEGSHDEAILAAVKLNLNHGLRFQEGDWEKIISLIASKEQWKDWSNRRLAEELKCNEGTIRRHRPENSGAARAATAKRQGKDGKMYPVKAKKNQKSETKLDTAPTSPTVATETPQANNESQTPDRATDANTVEISETPIRELRANRENAHPEAWAERERILEDISALVCRINRWFDSAPEVLHNEFAGVLQKRFQEIIGTEPTPSR